MTATDPTQTTQPTRADPIDVLIPPRRPWWVRLAIAVILIGGVGLVGYSWRFGLVRPAPECCGDGSSFPQIGLSSEPDAVAISTYFYNSSGRAVTITAASAELPGATVLGVAPYDESETLTMPPHDLATLPFDVPGRTGTFLAITFTPDACTTGPDDWGAVTLDLAVAGDHWYPTLGRSFTLPDPVVEAGRGHMGALPPADLDQALQAIDQPLEAACLLLGR